MKKELPEGWRWSTLGEECEINPRKTKDIRGNDNQETSFVPMEAVDGDKGIISEIRIVPFSKVKNGYTYFEENDVLFAKITPCMQNKKSAIANGLINGFGFGTTEFHVLRCKKNVIPEWIYYFIRNPRFIEEAENNFTGAVGQQRVQTSFLENYPIIVPPIVEQHQIVDKLNKQMAQIEMLKKDMEMQFEASKNMFQSYLTEIYDNDQINQNGTKLISQICESPQYGYTASSTQEKIGPKLLRITDIQEGKVDWDNVPYCICSSGDNKKYELKNDDIVFARIGATTGKSFLIKNPKEAIFASYLIRLRVKVAEIIPEFLYFFFQSPRYWESILKGARGGIMPNFNATMLSNLEVPVPDMTTQKNILTKFESFHGEYRNLIIQIQNQLNAINQLPASILNEVFGQYQINS